MAIARVFGVQFKVTNRMLPAVIFYTASLALSAGELSDWNDENLDVVIQATRLSHSKFRTPAAVTVLTQDNIKHRGFLAVHDIFRDVPGFRVSVIGSEKRVSYHGTAVRQNRRMRVSINGINALIGDGGYVEFNRLPFTVEDISKITITRGTNGGSYGDNAFLASIDFQLKTALHGRGTGLLIGAGDLKRRNVTAFVNQFSENYSLSLTANKYGIEEHAKRGIPAFNNDPDEDISRAHLNITNGPNIKNPLEVNLQWSEASHNIGGTFISPDIGEQLNRGFSSSIDQEVNLSDKQQIDWSISYSRQKEKLVNYACFDELLENYLDGAEEDQRESLILRATVVSAILQRPFEELCGSIAFAIKSSRTDAEAEYSHVIGPLNIAIGGSATYIEAESNEYCSNSETQENYRLFGEAAYNVLDFTFNFGAMAQNASNVDETQFAGRLAGNWQFEDNQSLRVAVSEGFRIPSLVESEAFWSIDIMINDASIPGYDGSLDVAAYGPTVRPERIRSYELGHFIALSSLGLKLDT